MSWRRDKFVTEYLRNGANATAAARDAGYANPNSIANRVLKDPYVIEQIRKAATPVVRKNEITIERLTDMCLGAHDRNDARAGDQLKAVETLAKLHKLLDTDVKHTHEHRFVGVQFDDMKVIDGQVIDGRVAEDTDTAED